MEAGAIVDKQEHDIHICGPIHSHATTTVLFKCHGMAWHAIAMP
jgi:hypothetical protein